MTKTPEQVKEMLDKAVELLSQAYDVLKGYDYTKIDELTPGSGGNNSYQYYGAVLVNICEAKSALNNISSQIYLKPKPKIIKAEELDMGETFIILGEGDDPNNLILDNYYICTCTNDVYNDGYVFFSKKKECEQRSVGSIPPDTLVCRVNVEQKITGFK